MHRSEGRPNDDLVGKKKNPRTAHTYSNQRRDLDDVHRTPRLSRGGHHACIDGSFGPVKFAGEINKDQSAYTYNCPVF